MFFIDPKKLKTRIKTQRNMLPIARRHQGARLHCAFVTNETIENRYIIVEVDSYGNECQRMHRYRALRSTRYCRHLPDRSQHLRFLFYLLRDKRPITLSRSLLLAGARNHGGFPSCEAMVYRKKGTLKRKRERAERNQLATKEV